MFDWLSVVHGEALENTGKPLVLEPPRSSFTNPLIPRHSLGPSSHCPIAAPPLGHESQEPSISGAPPGFSWLLLAPPGSSWLLLAPPGFSWPLLAPPGSSWLLLAFPGSSWLLLAPPGSSWLLLAPPGQGPQSIAKASYMMLHCSCQSRARNVPQQSHGTRLGAAQLRAHKPRKCPLAWSGHLAKFESELKCRLRPRHWSNTPISPRLQFRGHIGQPC